MCSLTFLELTFNSRPKTTIYFGKILVDSHKSFTLASYVRVCYYIAKQQQIVELSGFCVPTFLLIYFS